jgi:hypothetical protein
VDTHPLVNKLRAVLGVKTGNACRTLFRWKRPTRLWTPKMKKPKMKVNSATGSVEDASEEETDKVVDAKDEEAKEESELSNRKRRGCFGRRDRRGCGRKETMRSYMIS